MSTPSELNVDRTVQYVSDQFEIAYNGSDVFWTEPDFATIETGLLDPYLDPVFVAAIEGAIVDEVELHITEAPGEAAKQTSVVRGRDTAAYSVEKSVYITFAVSGQGQVNPSFATIPGFPTMPIIPGVTVPEYLAGAWTARSACAYLASKAGLSLAYSAPDYYIRENITVSGSVIGGIQQIVEPFSHFEPSKVDIWTEGTMLIVRSRGTGGAGLSMDVHDSRIRDLMIRKQFLGHIRVLRIIGASDAGVGPGGVAVTGFSDRENVDETTDANGNVTMRVTTVEHVRDIDGAVITQDINVYKDQGEGLVLVSYKHTVSEFEEALVAFPNVLLNSPKEVSRVITELNEQTFETSRTTVSHSYDTDGFLSAQDTRKEDFDADTQAFTLNSSEIKQYRDNAGGYQITTTQYDADGNPGDTRRTTVRGQRPGGGGGGRQAPTNISKQQPVTYATVIDLDAIDGKDVTIQNGNLLLPEIKIIADQARQVNGATEWEVNFTAIGFPWLLRGQYLTLTGLEDEGGTVRDVGPALITEARIEYREDSPSPTYLTFVKAVFWTQ